MSSSSSSSISYETRCSWQDGLKKCGLYYEGFVDAEKITELLEVHGRETASTFGTRSSRSPPSSKIKDEKGKENVSLCPELVIFLAVIS